MEVLCRFSTWCLTQAIHYASQWKVKDKVFWLNLDQSFSYLLDVGVEEFKNIFGTIISGRWCDKVAVKLPEIVFGKLML